MREGSRLVGELLDEGLEGGVLLGVVLGIHAAVVVVPACMRCACHAHDRMHNMYAHGVHARATRLAWHCPARNQRPGYRCECMRCGVKRSGCGTARRSRWPARATLGPRRAARRESSTCACRRRPPAPSKHAGVSGVLSRVSLGSCSLASLIEELHSGAISMQSADDHLPEELREAGEELHSGAIRMQHGIQSADDHLPEELREAGEELHSSAIRMQHGMQSADDHLPEELREAGEELRAVLLRLADARRVHVARADQRHVREVVATEGPAMHVPYTCHARERVHVCACMWGACAQSGRRASTWRRGSPTVARRRAGRPGAP